MCKPAMRKKRFLELCRIHGISRVDQVYADSCTTFGSTLTIQFRTRTIHLKDTRIIQSVNQQYHADESHMDYRKRLIHFWRNTVRG